MTDDRSDDGISRRTFVQTTGVLAGAGALGVAGTGTAAAAGGFDAAFANWRVREASKVWERGYRGRIDRTIGLTDTGIDARHPDVGPWNGVSVDVGSAGPVLKRDALDRLDGAALAFEGTLAPGAFDVTTSRHEFTAPADADRIEASLAWTPDSPQGGMDLALGLEHETDDGWEEIDESDGIIDNPQALGIDIQGGDRYALVAKTEANARAEYAIDALFYEYTETGTQIEETTYEANENAFGGTLPPGAPGTTTNEHPFHFDPEEAPGDPDFYGIEAVLDWTPEENDIELILENPDGQRIASSTRPTAPERITAPLVQSGEYTLVVESWANTVSDYELSYWLKQGNFVAGDEPGPAILEPETGAVWTEADGDDKVVGWYDAGPDYGEYARPRDQNGHGTHVASIMGGSGRASAVDTAETEEPRAVLTAGDVLSYEVEARAGTGVFASVYGTAVDVVVEGPDGRELDGSRLVGTDSSLLDSSIAETPTVHDTGTATYTVHVRPAEGEVASTGRVRRVSVGTFERPDETDGDRGGDGVSTLHAGVAPDAGLVGLQGLSDPTADAGRVADFFAREFNLRAVNMSWGNLGGLPLGAFGGSLSASSVRAVRQLADAGVLTVAAAGNSFTPANGNSEPAVAEEAVSVVSTGPLDGIVAYSSGGIGGVDEDEDEFDGKPDVTAPGGRAPAYPASIAAPVYDLIDAARSEDPDTPGEDQTVRGYTGKAGTSMASPYVNGVAALVAEAMDHEYGDAPETIQLPAPADAGREDALRLKQTILATASETPFTAAPYHTVKSVPHQPTYDFGGRDPYEGYGRVNPEAAVDAATRRLEPGSVDGTVGLNVPEDSRAVAGHITDEPGVYEIRVDFSHYAGGNTGLTKGVPHVDLFVYDAESPAGNGEPNIVARAQGQQGAASLQFTASTEADDGGIRCGTYYVVAKLVNVPGVVNGYDVQAHLDLSVDLVEDLIVQGTRSDSADAYTAGQTATYHLTVTADEPVVVRDVIPASWEVYPGQDDVDRVEEADDGTKHVYFAGDAAIQHAYRYHVRVADETGDYQVGPAEVTTDPDGDDWIAVSGTSDTNAVVGQGTSI